MCVSSTCAEDEQVQCVRQGNELAVRTTLLCLIGWLVKVQYVVEQPISSLLASFPCMAKMLDLTKPSIVSTYMGSFGGDSPKPLRLWGTSPWVKALRRGKPIRSNSSKPAQAGTMTESDRACASSGRVCKSRSVSMTLSESLTSLNPRLEISRPFSSATSARCSNVSIQWTKPRSIAKQVTLERFGWGPTVHPALHAASQCFCVHDSHALALIGMLVSRG